MEDAQAYREVDCSRDDVGVSGGFWPLQAVACSNLLDVAEALQIHSEILAGVSEISYHGVRYRRSLRRDQRVLALPEATFVQEGEKASNADSEPALIVGNTVVRAGFLHAGPQGQESTTDRTKTEWICKFCGEIFSTRSGKSRGNRDNCLRRHKKDLVKHLQRLTGLFQRPKEEIGDEEDLSTAQNQQLRTQGIDALAVEIPGQRLTLLQPNQHIYQQPLSAQQKFLEANLWPILNAFYGSDPKTLVRLILRSKILHQASREWLDKVKSGSKVDADVGQTRSARGKYLSVADKIVEEADQLFREKTQSASARMGPLDFVWGLWTHVARRVGFDTRKDTDAGEHCLRVYEQERGFRFARKPRKRERKASIHSHIREPLMRTRPVSGESPSHQDTLRVSTITDGVDNPPLSTNVLLDGQPRAPNEINAELLTDFLPSNRP